MITHPYKTVSINGDEPLTLEGGYWPSKGELYTYALGDPRMIMLPLPECKYWESEVISMKAKNDILEFRK